MRSKIIIKEWKNNWKKLNGRLKFKYYERKLSGVNYSSGDKFKA